MTLLTAAQAGLALLHDVGYAGSGTAASYEAVVVLDEMIAWVKTYLRGVALDEDALAVDEIAAVGPGGTHLGRKYTRRHLREYHRPVLVAQESHDSWEAAGGSELLERAAARTRELREAAPVWELDDAARRELERVVEGARTDVGATI
jgi:trimethylamine--corrinoid protein Co-methyltransferase